MKPPRLRFLLGLALAIALVLTYVFGGPLWRPLKARLSGKKTVGQVLRELEPAMLEKYKDLDTLTNNHSLALLAFKQERHVELWKQQPAGWKFIRSYPFTGTSGKLGPKLKQDDLQIPEGIYAVEYLNPNSAYHLSFKVSYPNDFDQKMATADGRTRLGNDIFVHGSVVSVGCIPVGDDKIEELFYLIAKNGYKNTKIIIAPVDFRLGKPAPEIEAIEWEQHLYEELREVLNHYPADEKSDGK